MELDPVEIIRRSDMGRSKNDPSKGTLDLFFWLGDLAQRVFLGRPIEAAEVPNVRLGKFQPVKLLGTGAYGAVFLARDMALHRDVALKLAWPGVLLDPAGSQRFTDEPRAMAVVKHAGIVEVYEAGTIDMVSFIAMEWIDGPTLADWSKAESFVGEGMAATIIHAVADAIGHAHAKGVIHRDLKPSNVLLRPRHDLRREPSFNPVVTDFGLARQTSLVSRSTMTATCAVLGTDHYMSPEQATGSNREVGPASDVFSLGVMLYELLSGRPPFDGETSEQVRLRIAEGEPTPLRVLRRGISKDLETIVNKSLESMPRSRYATARELAEDLRRFLHHEPILARPQPLWRRAAKQARRRPALMGFLAAIMISAAVMAGVVVAWINDRLASVRELEAARDDANRQRTAAEDRSRQVEQMLYAAQIRLAQENWNNDHLEVAWQALRSTPESLRGWDYHYLHHLFTNGHREIAIPDYSGYGCTLSPDGQLFSEADGDSDGDIWTHKVWETVSGRQISTLQGDLNTQEWWTSDPCFSPDNGFVAAKINGGFAIWDAHSGSKLRTIPARRVRRVAFSKDGRQIAAALHEGAIAVWDVATGEQKLKFMANSQPGLEGQAEYRPFEDEDEYAVHVDIAFSPDGQRIACGPCNERVKVWDASDGRELVSLEGEIYRADGLMFSPDGRRLAADGAGVVWIWDAQQGSLLRSIPCPTPSQGFYHPLAFSPDGRRITSSDDDGRIFVFDMESGNLQQTFKGHAGHVCAMVFAPDGKTLWTAGRGYLGGVVKSWDLVQGQRPITIPGKRVLRLTGAAGVAFTQDGKHIVTDIRRLPAIWDVQKGTVVRKLTPASSNSGFWGEPESTVLSLWGSPDRQSVLWGSSDGQSVAACTSKGLVFWNAADGRELRRISADCLRSTLSTDGTRCAIGLADGTVKVCDTESGEELWTVQGSGEFNTCSLAFSVDGRHLASSFAAVAAVDKNNKPPQIWEVATGQPVRTLNKDDNVKRFASSIAFSPDGNHLATVYHHDIHVWELVSGESRLELLGHAERVNVVTFSPDGRRIATGSNDRSIKIWNAHTGQELLTLSDGDGDIVGLAFSPDGRRLASVNEDYGVTVWEATEPEVHE